MGADAMSADARSADAVRVAVTGAHGYIGSCLSVALAAAGAEVRTFTRQRPALAPGGTLSPGLPGSQVLFHLASGVSPASAERCPAQVSADHDLFARLLDRLAELDRPPLVVLASSGVYVYDPGIRLPFREESPLVPRTAYGRAKLQLERELRDRRDAVPGVALRLATVYGPGQPARPGQGVIAHWMRAAREGAPVRLFGQPSTLRDFVYIGDVVAAMCRIAALASPPEASAPEASPSEASPPGASAMTLPAAVNIGSGQATSLDELLSHLRQVVGDLPAERVPDRGFDRYDAQLDVRLAASALGWAPQIPLATGLARTWQALTEQTPTQQTPTMEEARPCVRPARLSAAWECSCRTRSASTGPSDRAFTRRRRHGPGS